MISLLKEVFEIEFTIIIITTALSEYGIHSFTTSLATCG